MPLNKGKNCYITNLLNTCKLPFYVHNIHMNNDFLVLHQIKVSKNTSALAGKSRTYQGRMLCHSFDFLNLKYIFFNFRFLKFYKFHRFLTFPQCCAAVSISRPEMGSRCCATHNGLSKFSYSVFKHGHKMMRLCV